MDVLTAWVFSAMVAFVPPRQNNVPQLAAYERIAIAITSATRDPDEAALLASIGAFESGYAPFARGKLGEVGVWQLMQPAPKDLRGQAREALRRWRVQGGCGYTGEAANAKSTCPLAKHRLERAQRWTAAHPF